MFHHRPVYPNNNQRSNGLKITGLRRIWVEVGHVYTKVDNNI